MAYRVKHVPTGYYYQPVNSAGNNLSKNGKIYHTEAHARRALGTSSRITISVDKNSLVYKATFDKVQYHESKWSYNKAHIFANVEDFVIEELEKEEKMETENKTTEITKEQLLKAVPGQVYNHYKGGKYKVLHLAPHTETGELLVIYQSLNFGSYHARPLENWCTPVNYNPRFWPNFE